MRPLLILSCLFGLGCAGPTAVTVPSRPAQAQPAPSQPAPPSPPPGAAPDPLAAVPPPPAECRHLEPATVRPTRGCGGPAQALAALDRALGESARDQRDQALGGLEGCTEFDPGLLVALRTELAPPECGDHLVADYAKTASLGPAVRDALLGLALGAKLERLVRTPPELAPPHTKPRVQAFIQGKMADWVKAEAAAIGELARKGSRLGSYGKGIVAVEAGMADMRFVEVFRRVPLPEELQSDPELRDAYYASLDQGLDPRKSRGRDAALVGLRILGEQGVLRDARVDQARALLSRLYNGRRIDALDGLLLPPLPRAEPKTAEQRLATILPTFYADSVLKAADPNDAGLLRALLTRGLPSSLRTRLDQAELGPEARQLYARGLFELGRTYWRAADFGRARAVARGLQGSGSEARLLGALGLALEQGPKDAATMMLRGPMPQGIGNVSELDALGRTRGEIAGMAAYDAAFIRELVPPAAKDPGFFRDLAVRYGRAATLLTAPAEQKLARDRAEAATATARAVR
jgi:hypothetical protein